MLFRLFAPLLIQLSNALLLLFCLDLRQLSDVIHQFEHSRNVVTRLELVGLILVLERVKLVYYDTELVLDVFLHFFYLLLEYLLNELLDGSRNINALVLKL